MRISKCLVFVISVMSLAITFGCGGGGGGSDSGTATTGTLSMSMTDAKPLLPEISGKTITNVFVEIDEVLVHSSDRGWEPLEMVQTPYVIDLLQFTDGATTEFVPPAELPSGKYTQVRLSVASAKLRFNEEQNDEVEITIPSGNLKTDKNFDFDVSQGAAVDITIDFDLSKSLVLEGAVCKLKPVLHIVDTAGAATIEGTIDNLLFSESYIVITVYDSTDQQQEYTKLQVFKDEEATDGKTGYSIFWLVPNQAYTVSINYNPVADDNPDTEEIEETQDKTVEVPSASDEDQLKYPKGTLPPGAIYQLDFLKTPNPDQPEPNRENSLSR